MSDHARSDAADVAAAVGSLIADPSRTAVLCDFDGTLAPIVDDPARARPLPGAVEVLARLSEQVALVAVVSGRPAAFLTAQLGAEAARVKVSGLYGAQLARYVGGTGWEVGTHGDAEPWKPVVAAVAAEAAAAAPAGVIVEDKELSLTVHWRTAPRHQQWVEEWVAAAAERTGLAVHDAKASLELRIPVARDKGTVVAELAQGMDAVCFVGDDIGDLPALRALHRLPGTAVAVVVASTETPAVLLDEADLVVDGPAGALDFLTHLTNSLQ